MLKKLKLQLTGLALGLALAGLSSADAANVQFTAGVPNGSLNFSSPLTWSVWNSDDMATYDVTLNNGQTGHDVVTTMRVEMDSFANAFSGDGSISGNTLTVDTATSGDFVAAGEVSMSMTVMPPTLPPGSVPDLPLLFKPHEIHGFGVVSVVLMLLEGANGQPIVPAGGNGSLVATVDLDGTSSPIVAAMGFSAGDTTADILLGLDTAFASATLPDGAHYAGLIEGAPAFYTDDLRPLSAGFSVTADSELNFVTGAAIYFVPEPQSFVLLLGAVSILFIVPCRPLRRFTHTS